MILFDKKQWYIENRAKIIERSKQWQKNNPEKVLEYGRKYCARCKDKKNKKGRERYRNNIKKERERDIRWRENNPEYHKEYYAQNRNDILKRCKQWRENNPEKVKEKDMRYYENNREKIYENFRKWKAENPEKARETYHQWRTKRLKTDLKFNLNDRMRRAIAKSLKGNKEGRSWEGLVGFTLNDLSNHLNKNMPVGYTWKDYLDGILHIDHIIPISAFNFTRPEHIDFKRCWALKNLRLLLARENLKKHNRLEKPFQPALKILI